MFRNSSQIFTTSFSLCGRLLVSLSLDVIWIYTLDIYPTAAKTSGAGGGSLCIGFATLLSPQMENLMNIWKPLPFVISSCLVLVASIFCWTVLPETIKMTSKDYIKDTEIFIQKSHKAICTKECFCFKVYDDNNDTDIENEHRHLLNK